MSYWIPNVLWFLLPFCVGSLFVVFGKVRSHKRKKTSKKTLIIGIILFSVLSIPATLLGGLGAFIISISGFSLVCFVCYGMNIFEKCSEANFSHRKETAWTPSTASRLHREEIDRKREADLM